MGADRNSIIRSALRGGAEIIQWEFSPGPRRDVTKIERAEMSAMQREHRRTTGRKHPSHLMITSLGEREFCFARGNEL